LSNTQLGHPEFSGGFQPGLFLVQVQDQQALAGNMAAQAKDYLPDHIVEPPVTGGQAPEFEQGFRQALHGQKL